MGLALRLIAKNFHALYFIGEVDMMFDKVDSTICTLGSCFALEIRRELESRGFNTCPKGEANRQLVWYNTYSIAYEFKRTFDGLKTNYDDCWRLSDGRYQEPSRRLVFAEDMSSLKCASEMLDSEIINGIRSANIYILTLGLSEVWMHKNSKRALCAHPKYGLRNVTSDGLQNVTFHNSTKEDNLRNLTLICKLIQRHNPNASIIFTVSPVPLNKTFTEKPLAEANAISKEKLQWAAKEVVSKFPNASYFDSFEYCMSIPSKKRYRRDKRHVKPEVIAGVISRFEDQFLKN
jgi:hypothetical protein